MTTLEPPRTVKNATSEKTLTILPRRVLTLLATLALVSVAACGDDGPSGPGSLDGLVRGAQPLGAVVLDVRGDGIVGFEEQPGTRVFSAATDATGTSHRVVLVGEAAGALGFRVRVEDRGGPAPTATVVAASDGEDRTVSAVGGIQVDIGSQG